MTINEIATLAGVSKSTVSRVINGAANVEEKTRKRVLKVIKENDYVPSAMARGLSNRESNLIGWILPEIDDVFFGEITQGIYEFLADTQYTMVLFITQNNIEYELKALRAMRQQNIKGLLITSSSGYEDVAYAKKVKKAIQDISVPVVMIDRLVDGAMWAGVYSDYYKDAYKATKALIEAGFMEIGGLFSDMNLHLGRERKRGFEQALQEYGLKKNLMYLEDGPAFADDFYEITCRLVEENKLPQAVFLSNGIIAKGFFKAILEKGIVPGRDVHVMSYDYLEALDITGTPYSYLKRNCKLIGEAAVKVLLRSFQENSAVREESIVPAILQLHPTLKND